MTNSKLTFLILALFLIPLLSACGTSGMDTPSGALATPSSVPPTSVGMLPPPTLLYFWAQW